MWEGGILFHKRAGSFVTTMIINGEKAPPFSAKTLNLPVPAVDSSAQIIELSRQRYAQEKPVVEDLVRRAAGLAIDRPSFQPPAVNARPLRPQAQAQLNRADQNMSAKQRSQQPKDIGKIAAANNSTQTAKPQQQSQSSSRRRRRSRSHSGGSSTSVPKTRTQQAESKERLTADSQEMVIRLR